MRLLVSAAAVSAALVLVPSVARADYEAGIVPDGTNAFVHGRRTVHLSLLGTSELGITEHTEIGTYLLADAMLFPNLRLEHQLDATEHSAASFMIGAGAGALPFAFGEVLPLPGGVVGVGGAGFVWGAMQTATLIGTMRSPERGLAVSLNAGGFAMEGGFAGVFAGVGAGGGGAGGAGGATSDSASRVGMTAGVELDKTLGRRNALVFAVDAWRWKSIMDGPSGLVYPRINVSHQFSHWQLTGGAYALVDLPDMKALHSKMPVAPFINVAWNRY